MAKSKVQTVLVRRKREFKTDYKNRLNILKSRKPRLVIRKTNKNIIAQVISYMPDGDKVEMQVSSKELEKMGWTHSRNNLPAAYLTGLLLSKKSKISHAVLDLGLQKAIKGSRIYACLKGCVDGGMDIPHSEDVYPTQDRLDGKHIKEFKKIDIEKSLTDLKKKIESTKK